MLTFTRYIEVYFTFGLVHCVRYNKDFVKSKFVKIEVLLHTLYCNFGQAEENPSLYQGLCYIEVH